MCFLWYISGDTDQNGTNNGSNPPLSLVLGASRQLKCVDPIGKILGHKLSKWLVRVLWHLTFLEIISCTYFGVYLISVSVIRVWTNQILAAC